MDFLVLNMPKNHHANLFWDWMIFHDFRTLPAPLQLVRDPPCANSTSRQNPPFHDTPVLFLLFLHCSLIFCLLCCFSSLSLSSFHYHWTHRFSSDSSSGQILPEDNNPMQFELASLNQYCIESKMSINKKKSVCMLFNRAVKHDFMPKLYLNQDSPLEVVEEMKLVGYQLRSDLRTISNTNYIIKRAWKRMWIVRRRKVCGASE